MKTFTIIVMALFSSITMESQVFNQKLESLISVLESEQDSISQDRKTELNKLAEIINNSLITNDFAKVIFVCTHNSRRSQLAQLWFRAAAKHYKIDEIYTYSGGIESTAFNHRMVAAIERAGFNVTKLDNWENPKYIVHLSKKDDNMDIYFSKKYDDSYNPRKDFIAVMVCSSADEACPVVHGADSRFSLTYLDPKAYENTAKEEFAYDQKVREIGRELLYLASLLN